MDQTQDHILGIDLGTTNSVVAVIEGDSPVVITNSEGSNRTPSVVGFSESGEVVVGELAVRQAASNPSRTITAVKRLMGRFYSDIEDDADTFPYVITQRRDEVLLDIGGKGYTPQQIASLILKKIKATVEDYLGEDVTKAVITVPAYFDDLQRQATKDAGEAAGLEVLRLINEPTAAAMAYGLGKEAEETVAIYDFGGGTFDISVLDIDDNSFEVLATSGDSRLGGEDIDALLVDRICDEFHCEHGVDLRDDPLNLHRVKEAVERAKCDLSSMPQTRVTLPFVAYLEGTPLHLDALLTRDEFEGLIEPLVSQTISLCRDTLGSKGIKSSKIDKVILVGGSSRIPLVQDTVADFFDLDPFKGVNPDEVVAMGAATQAGVLSGKLEEVVLLDVTPHTLGIEVRNGQVSTIIEKNTTVPVKAAKLFTTTEDNQEFVAVHVLQGEHEQSSDNRSLGRFTLTGLPQRRRGSLRVEITFFINSDGIVEISAKDLETGRENALKIVHSHLEEGERRARRSPRRRPRRRRSSSPGKRADLAGVDLAGDSPALPDPSTSPTFEEIAAEVRVEHQADQGGRRDDVSFPAMARPPGALLPEGETAPGLVQGPRKRSDGPSLRTDSTRVVVSGGPKSRLRDVVQEPGADGVTVNEPIDGTGVSAKRPKDATSVTAKMEAAEKLLQAGRDDPQALDAYHEAGPDYALFLQSHPEAEWATVSLARAYIICNRFDDALQLLRESCEQHRLGAKRVVACYDELIERLPDCREALLERGRIYAQLGSGEKAIADLERAESLGGPADRPVEALEALYRKRLADQPDPPTQFKLVKICLRKDNIDGAIEILERLEEHPDHTAKAGKILGLCYWQKGRPGQAWARLQKLEPTEDICDIISRLADDMESSRRLDDAREALAYLAENSSDSMPFAERLRTIDSRIGERDKEQIDGGQNSGLASLGDSRFVLLNEINRGSMGVVYRAKDLVLDEVVSLKVLNDYLCVDPLAVERFKTEARAARKLAHPNIVRIHDFFESGNKRFLSMEFIDGQDLKALLAEKGPLEPDRLSEISISIARALDYAHSRSIIHRDIKPANIMVSAGWEIRITDFGIAKVLQGNDLTQTASIVMGTPLYMAPEQVEGKPVTARTDIYSLGIVMYELISGRPPFTEGNIEYHHVQTEPPPLPDSVPQDLAAVIMKAIKKSPDDRFSDAGEMAQTLQDL